jgi:hypothetical protein
LIKLLGECFVRLVAVAAVVVIPMASAMGQSYEMHTTRSVAEILPPDLRQGKHFKVRDQVLAYDS